MTFFPRSGAGRPAEPRPDSTPDSGEFHPSPEKGSHSQSQTEEEIPNDRPGTDSTVVMATEALTTLAFPQPLIDPVLKINITMKQYLHSIYFNWLLHKPWFHR